MTTPETPDEQERQFLVWSETARRWDLATLTDLQRLVTAAVLGGHALPKWIYALGRDQYTAPRRVNGQVTSTSPTGDELRYALIGVGTAVHGEFVIRSDGPS